MLKRLDKTKQTVYPQSPYKTKTPSLLRQRIVLRTIAFTALLAISGAADAFTIDSNQSNLSNAASPRLSNRIKSASDGAAALAISELAGSQINILKVRTKSAKDEISMIQTAEGALNEISASLSRMRELAVQSANDDSATPDRAYLDTKVTSLTNNIDRLAKTTLSNWAESTSTHAYRSWGALVMLNTATAQLNYNGNAADTLKLYTDGAAVQASGPTVPSSANISPNRSYTFDLETTYYKVADDLDTDAVVRWDVSYNTNENNFQWQHSAEQNFGSDDWLPAHTPNQNIYWTYDTPQRVQNAVKQANNAANLILNKSAGALEAVDIALNTVNDTRRPMIAKKNLLSITVSNLVNTINKLGAGASRISDTGSTSEGSDLARSQILAQAGIAMLAQANATPQNVLSLLG